MATDTQYLKEIAEYTKKSCRALDELLGDRRPVQARGDDATVTRGPRDVSIDSDLYRGASREIGRSRRANFAAERQGFAGGDIFGFNIRNFLPPNLISGIESFGRALSQRNVMTFAKSFKGLLDERAALRGTGNQFDRQQFLAFKQAIGDITRFNTEAAGSIRKARDELEELMLMQAADIDVSDEFENLKEEVVELTRKHQIYDRELISSAQTLDELDHAFQTNADRITEINKVIKDQAGDMYKVMSDASHSLSNTIGDLMVVMGRYGAATAASIGLGAGYLRSVERQGLQLDIASDMFGSIMRGISPEEFAAIAAQNRQTLQIMNAMSGRLGESGDNVINSVGDVADTLEASANIIQENTNLFGTELIEATLSASSVLASMGAAFEEPGEFTQAMRGVSDFAKQLGAIGGMSTDEAIKQLEALSRDEAFQSIVFSTNDTAGQLFALAESSERLYKEFGFTTEKFIQYQRDLAQIDKMGGVDRIVQGAMVAVTSRQLGIFTEQQVRLLQQFRTSPESLSGPETAAAMQLYQRAVTELANQRAESYREGFAAGAIPLEIMSGMANMGRDVEAALAARRAEEENRDAVFDNIMGNRRGAQDSGIFTGFVDTLTDVIEVSRGIISSPAAPLMAVGLQDGMSILAAGAMGIKESEYFSKMTASVRDGSIQASIGGALGRMGLSRIGGVGGLLGSAGQVVRGRGVMGSGAALGTIMSTLMGNQQVMGAGGAMTNSRPAIAFFARALGPVMTASFVAAAGAIGFAVGRGIMEVFNLDDIVGPIGGFLETRFDMVGDFLGIADSATEAANDRREKQINELATLVTERDKLKTDIAQAESQGRTEDAARMREQLAELCATAREQVDKLDEGINKENVLGTATTPAAMAM